MKVTTALLAAGILICASTTSAGQAPAWTPNQSNPYRGLFGTKIVAPGAPTPSTPVVQAKPTVKCGMTMILGDPKIDPGIARKPVAPSTRFPMRAIEPPICR